MKTTRRSILPLFKLSPAEVERFQSLATADDLRTFAAEMAVKFGAIFDGITDRVWLDSTESGRRAGEWVSFWESLAVDGALSASDVAAAATETVTVSKSRFLAARYVAA